MNQSQLADLLKSGSFSLAVPTVVRIALQDRLQRGVTAFDIIGYAASNLPAEVFEDHIVEYTGSVVERLDIYERICLCQLTQLCGSVCAYAVFDEMTRKFLARRGRTDFKIWFSDNKAFYNQDYVLTVSGLEPQIAPAGNITSSTRVKDIGDIGPIGLAFIGGPCAGGIEAIRQVSELLKGQRVNESTRLFLSPLTEHG
jgi:3-isopropylmalate/(R)-2-methylmalate dehydratase large subunit